MKSSSARTARRRTDFTPVRRFRYGLLNWKNPRPTQYVGGPMSVRRNETEIDFASESKNVRRRRGFKNLKLLLEKLLEKKKKNPENIKKPFSVRRPRATHLPISSRPIKRLNSRPMCSVKNYYFSETAFF